MGYFESAADETDDRVRRLRAFAERFVAGYPGANGLISVWKINAEAHQGRAVFVVYYVRIDKAGCEANEDELAEAATVELAASDPDLAAIARFVGDYEK
jgi:hypothetical protein